MFFCEKKERFIRSVEAAEGTEGTDHVAAGEYLFLGKMKGLLPYRLEGLLRKRGERQSKSRGR